MQGTYYSHITKLPLARFIDVDVDGDFQALIIEGEVDEKTLREAWEVIQEQYVQALGDAEQRLYLSLLKEVNALAISLQQVEILLQQLRSRYVALFLKELNKILKANIQLTDKEGNLLPDYDKRLDRAISLANPIRMQHDLKRVHLDKLKKKMEGGNRKATREYYQETIIALSNHQKRELDEEKLTVYKYVVLIKDLNRFLSTPKR